MSAAAALSSIPQVEELAIFDREQRRVLLFQRAAVLARWSLLASALTSRQGEAEGEGVAAGSYGFFWSDRAGGAPALVELVLKTLNASVCDTMLSLRLMLTTGPRWGGAFRPSDRSEAHAAFWSRPVIVRLDVQSGSLVI